MPHLDFYASLGNKPVGGRTHSRYARYLLDFPRFSS